MSSHDPRLAALLEFIRCDYEAILVPNLVGIYIHGSIAFDCFEWTQSDVDIIVVVQEPISDDVARTLLAATQSLNESAPPKGIEMSVVLHDHCRHFIYPTPYELHFSPMHRDSLCPHPRLCDPDLAAHFTVILAVGYPLMGSPVTDVFDPVPHADYLDSIWLDVEHARTDIHNDPVYVVLNLCRVLAYLRDGLVLSKQGGGEWGLVHLPAHAELIRAALTQYAGGEAMHRTSAACTAFADDLLCAIDLMRI